MKRLEEMALEGNSAVQMVLSMVEVLGWLRKEWPRVRSTQAHEAWVKAWRKRSPSTGLTFPRNCG